MSESIQSTGYIGRFAPSPSGPLHFGSLVTAVASYLDARAHRGLWLIRMEDLDPDREPPGAAGIILQQLADYGMQSDQPVLYQSSRLAAYQAALTTLQDRHLCFSCGCSRQQVREMGAIYDGTCRFHPPKAGKKVAIRIAVPDQLIEFNDLIQGVRHYHLAKETGDFIVRRKDGLFAYQLAVVVDDAYQNITHIVRGCDLMDSTPRQMFLQSCLGYPSPVYGHVPVITNELGQKLSKQHFADPVSRSERRSILHAAIRFLGQNPPRKHHELGVSEQLDWAIEHWDIQAIPKLATIPQHGLPL
ncbi:MAG: tRNA glutamyl-Q(34) synthetase GluQRS [Gammaproteobacteria bacterium]|nr:tRNA glutamyl-Q(34) synthetase GluQRS [Planctomycetaceae bacterium]MCB1672258.1 tRNA glutamyl-Q(34) synthetase GluQRS [Pseudomonadales bacterium]MCP5345507.1 tRNA glutamyl-Q(34) synthetase GluQRS [Pseudomonadales bacterium]